MIIFKMSLLLKNSSSIIFLSFNPHIEIFTEGGPLHGPWPSSNLAWDTGTNSKEGEKIQKKVVDKPAIVKAAVYILFVSLSSSYFFCP